MGEWSKSIGEKGEKIVKFIFEELLQFNSLVENSSIQCNNSREHKRKSAKKDRTTHGLDGLFYSESPIEDGLLDTVIISSKYTNNYPKSPKTLFKEHLKDLAHTIECFKNSKENSEINQKFNSVTKTEITGVLVWLSNGDDSNYDITSKVTNIIIDNSLVFDKIILLDNNKINFLYESIYRIIKINSKQNVSFAYHNSSLNYNGLRSHYYGTSFPINYLFSDIIPLRVKKNNEVYLTIFINDDFSKENFSQILSFAMTFDHLNSIEKTIINFTQYDNLTNENIVKDILTTFPKYKFEDNLYIKKFPSDYRDL